MERRVEKTPMPVQLRELALRELREADFGLGGRARQAVECLLDLTWVPSERPPIDLDAARHTLDASHAGMGEVKEAVLDFLAAEEWRRRQDRPVPGEVVCLVGPPGIGKTSIAATVAEVSGRRLESISLGGVDDVFLQGCDQAYSHSRPGEIVRRLRRSGRHPSDVVFLLDEIDKVVQIGPHAVVGPLLALLDPQQNHAWQDHYLDAFPLDLSGALFVTTANDEEAIPLALRDRLRLISLPGYSPDEQISISLTYLRPKLLADAGIDGQIELTDDAVTALVTHYPLHPGMRQIQARMRTVIARALRMHLLSEKRVKVTLDLVQAMNLEAARVERPVGFRA